MGQFLETTVTKLEMTARPSGFHPPPPLGQVAVLQAKAIPVSFYRYLYDAVGGPWCWVERKRLDDKALAEVLGQESVQVFVLYVDGVPAGFCELEWAAMPTANLKYFGLTPDFTGRRLGPFFLDQTLDLLWARGPERVTVDTCTLDHPKALPLYQRAGFVAFEQERQTLELLDGQTPPPSYRPGAPHPAPGSRPAGGPVLASVT